MNYRFTHKNAVQVLYLYRLLSDMDNRAILDEVNRRLQDGCKSVVVDLSHLDYIDSTGLNLLLALWRHLRHFGCQLLLTEPQPSVMRLFELTRLRAVFDFIPSVETALVPNQ
ncbi:MAG: STAS domain-containing protein [Saprospiraceae bacterium]|nr:STAS domain-containing protein [Saprospiraceae bacterium]